jgi:hypothetical protein
MMRTILTLAVAGLAIVTAIDIAAAQSRRGAAAQQQTRTSYPSGLPPCSERPFARDCDRRGTW